MIRTDLWVSAFVRRHNHLGHICVISRRGDPIAGQIFVEIDHLNGAVSLYTPAPAMLLNGSEDRIFQKRLARSESANVRERIARESAIDPDLWVISLELRSDEFGLTLVGD